MGISGVSGISGRGGRGTGSFRSGFSNVGEYTRSTGSLFGNGGLFGDVGVGRGFLTGRNSAFGYNPSNPLSTAYANALATYLGEPTVSPALSSINNAYSSGALGKLGSLGNLTSDYSSPSSKAMSAITRGVNRALGANNPASSSAFDQTLADMGISPSNQLSNLLLAAEKTDAQKKIDALKGILNLNFNPINKDEQMQDRINALEGKNWNPRAIDRQMQREFGDTYRNSNLNMMK